MFFFVNTAAHGGILDTLVHGLKRIVCADPYWCTEMTWDIKFSMKTKHKIS